MQNLKLITAPSSEPVTLDYVKMHAHINHDVEDAILGNWISSARTLAEDFQHRAFIEQVWELEFDCFPKLPISLPRSPIIKVLSIKIYDCNNVESVLYESEIMPASNADFLIDINSTPGRISLAYNKVWPSIVLRSMSAVKIRYSAGYSSDASKVPANVKDAIMLYCTYRNENRAAEVDAPPQFYNLLRHDRVII